MGTRTTLMPLWNVMRSGVSIPTEDLVLWWRLNEGTGAVAGDWSDNEYDGQFGAGAAAPSWVSNGIEFDGNDYVTVAFASELSQPLTILVGVTRGTGISVNHLFNCKNSNAGPLVYLFSTNNSIVEFCNGTEFSGPINQAEGSTHYYGCVYDGASSLMRSDGGAAANKTGILDTAGADGITIGGNYEGSGAFLTSPSRIHDVRIYSRAMSDADMDWHYEHVKSLRPGLF